MIKRFVLRYEQQKQALRDKLAAAEIGGYETIVRAVVEVLHHENPSDFRAQPDAERITAIDHGDCQGTLLFVVGAAGYQPSTYWAVPVGYGSCSGCDTLQDINSSHHRESDSDPLPSAQVDDYMTLALHIVQGLRLVCGDAEEEMADDLPAEPK